MDFIKKETRSQLSLGLGILLLFIFFLSGIQITLLFLSFNVFRNVSCHTHEENDLGCLRSLYKHTFVLVCNLSSKIKRHHLRPSQLLRVNNGSPKFLFVKAFLN